MNEDIIALRIWSRGFWVRVLGYGPHVMVARNHVKLFSESAGYRKAWYFAGLRFSWLTP